MSRKKSTAAQVAPPEMDEDEVTLAETHAEPEGEGEAGSEDLRVEQSEPIPTVELGPIVPYAIRLPEGYVARHFEVQLSQQHAEKLRRLAYALNRDDRRLKNDRHVESGADAIRWLLEQLEWEECA